MSARELRGRKRLQSNADEATAKRSKTAQEDSEEENIEVEQQPVKKTATKGKGKKGKRCVSYFYEGLYPAYNLSVG
jgi:hypothetical protein